MRNLKKIFTQNQNMGNDYRVADFYHANSEMSDLNLKEHIQKIEEYYSNSINESTEKDIFPFSKKIFLPKGYKFNFFVNFSKLINSRRTIRRFSNKKIYLKDIAIFLKLSYGNIQNKNNIFSTIPSAGAIFPLHIYLIILNSDIKDGIYHYYFKNTFLDEIAIRDNLKSKINEIIILKNLDSVPAFLIVITANLKEICKKYGDRGYRFCLIESGHLGQNICLIAEYLKWNSVPLGGFHDQNLASLLKINYQYEKPLYVFAIGNK